MNFRNYERQDRRMSQPKLIDRACSDVRNRTNRLMDGTKLGEKDSFIVNRRKTFILESAKKHKIKVSTLEMLLK